MSFRQDAILKTHGTVAVVSENTPEALDGSGNVVTLDEALITAEISRLQAEYDSKQYSRDRAEEYAKLNQYEMMFDDQRDSTTTWVDAVNAIKAQFPKPS